MDTPSKLPIETVRKVFDLWTIGKTSKEISKLCQVDHQVVLFHVALFEVVAEREGFDDLRKNESA